MGYQYNYDFDFPYDLPSVEPEFGEAFGSMAGNIFGFVLGFVLVFYLLILAFGVVTYVLQSLGLYTVAKRRGIHNSWLAWLPVGNMWILGSISDQYQYVVKGRVRNRRKSLVGLTIAMLFSGVPGLLGTLAWVFSEAAAMQESDAVLGVTVGIVMITYLVVLILSIIAIVLQFMSLYDLYSSCEPGNAVLYLVLSIIFGVSMPFFVFVCRNKDGGMPPRKTAKPEQPVIQIMDSPEEETPEDIQPQEEQE